MNARLRAEMSHSRSTAHVANAAESCIRGACWPLTEAALRGGHTEKMPSEANHICQGVSYGPTTSRLGIPRFGLLDHWEAKEVSVIRDSVVLTGRRLSEPSAVVAYLVFWIQHTTLHEAEKRLVQEALLGRCRVQPLRSMLLIVHYTPLSRTAWLLYA